LIRLPKSESREGTTRQRFLDAGARVFASHGYAGASMEQVADEAGLSRAALYKHFANKEALFLDVAVALHEGAADAARTALTRARRGRTDPVGMILDFMLARHRHYAMHLGNSPHAAELAEESSRRCGALVRKHAEVFHAGLEELIAGYAKSGRIALKPELSSAALADMLVAASKGLKAGEGQFGGAGYEAAFERMARTLLAGAMVRRRSP
jgi:AcrR family transcriptional regulator